MKIELYLISSQEEYTNMHMCRRHWNFQWRGRRSGQLELLNGPIRLRKESFGGLMRTTDGKLWKLDHEAFFWLDLLVNN